MSNTYSDHFKKMMANKKREVHVTKIKNLFPFKAITVSIGGAALCLLALYSEEEKLLASIPNIRFSLFESSRAQDSATQRVPQASQETKPESSSSKHKYEEIEEKHLLNLAERKRELDVREQDLLKLEKEIEEKNSMINERLNELKKIREQIASVLKSKVDEDNKKIDHLVDVYSAMRPGQVAKIFEDLDEELAVRVLSKMKKKSAADILNLMKVEKARKFTELYTGFERSPTSEKP
jgi:flagellar motility protein MotE (MotC chaperone)